MYPGEVSDPRKAHGKLRLLYECSPLALLAEQAGGYASDGVGPILNIQPTSLHQRVPLFIGNRELVMKAEEMVQEHDQEWLSEYKEVIKRADDTITVP